MDEMTFLSYWSARHGHHFVLHRAAAFTIIISGQCFLTVSANIYYNANQSPEVY